MFSTVGNTTSRHSQSPFGKGYGPPIPKGFTVRVFKGPTLSSFPHTATAKFDPGYHTLPLADPRQNQSWYPSFSRSQNLSKAPSAPRGPSEPPRSRTADNVTVTSFNRGYASNANAVTPSYSIYQSSKDTYIYEPSLSSKSDIYSNLEYDGNSTTTFSPSSAFSPAMSTDSITTLKSPISGYSSLTERDSRPSTPTPSTSRSSFIPGLSQAHSAIRGIFRSQTPREAQSSRLDTAFASNTPSITLSADDALPRERASSQGRSTTPIGLSVSSVSSGPGDRNMPHIASSYLAPLTHSYAASTLSESEHNELDRMAKANAQYNAASSASSSAYYSARGDSADALASRSSMLSGTREVPGPIYTTSPLRSSPEQQHVFPGGDTQHTRGSTNEPHTSYIPTTETMRSTEDRYVFPSSSYHCAPSEKNEDTVAPQYRQFIPPLGEWIESLESRQAQARRETEARPSTSIPQFVNEGPPQSRYVPASRTMSFSGQAAPQNPASSLISIPSLGDDRTLPIPPPTSQPRIEQRERRTSTSQPPTISVSSIHDHERKDGSTNFSRERNRDMQNSPIGQRTVSAPYATKVDGVPIPPHGHRYSDTATTDRLSNVSNPPSSHITSFRTSPTQEQWPSSAHAEVFNRRDHSPPNPVNRPPLRSSPEQEHQIPQNVYAVPSAREYPITASALPSLRASPEQRLRTTSVSYTGLNSEHPQAREYLAPLGNTTVISNSPPILGVSLQEQHPPGFRNAHDSVAELRVSASPVATTFSGGQKPEIRNSPRRTSVNTFAYDDPQSHIPNGLSVHQNRNDYSPIAAYPSRPSQLHTSSLPQDNDSTREVSPTRARYNGTGHPFNSNTNNPSASTAPPSASADPRQGQDQYRTSFAEPAPVVNAAPSYSQNARINEERASFASSTFVNEWPEGTSSTSARKPLPEVRRPYPEPQRRHSDGDRFINVPNRTVQEGDGPAPTVPAEPQRRFSDGDQIQPTVSGNKAVALFRTVRWNENLVCPSPIFPSQRRKGWFNRRGDQLWTNEGAYKPPPQGQEYPPDLDGYPEHGQGWMNEEGVRIDMGHRLIPKPPLRSALKQTRTQRVQLNS